MLDINVWQALDLGILHDCFTRGIQTLRIGIAFAARKLAAHVVHHFIGRAETERRRIANVELQDGGALCFHACCLVNNGAADVVEHVIEFRGFAECSHGAPFWRGVGRTGRGRGRRSYGGICACGSRFGCCCSCCCNAGSVFGGSGGYFVFAGSFVENQFRGRKVKRLCDFLKRASFDVDHASAFVFRNGGFLHANLVAQFLLG